MTTNASTQPTAARAEAPGPDRRRHHRRPRAVDPQHPTMAVARHRQHTGPVPRPQPRPGGDRPRRPAGRPELRRRPAPRPWSASPPQGWHTTVARMPNPPTPGPPRTTTRRPPHPGRPAAAIRHLQTIGCGTPTADPSPAPPSTPTTCTPSSPPSKPRTPAAPAAPRPGATTWPPPPTTPSAPRPTTSPGRTSSPTGPAAPDPWAAASRTPPSPDSAAQTTVPGRDFGHHGDLPISAAHGNAAAFAMLYGPGDEPTRLAARRRGTVRRAGSPPPNSACRSLPLSATVEVATTRERIRRLLADLGYPQLVLRFGTIDPAGTAPPHTPRLPTEQIIERA